MAFIQEAKPGYSPCLFVFCISDALIPGALLPRTSRPSQGELIPAGNDKWLACKGISECRSTNADLLFSSGVHILDLHPPVLITPWPGTGQRRAAPRPQSPLILFKPTPAYPALPLSSHRHHNKASVLVPSPSLSLPTHLALVLPLGAASRGTACPLLLGDYRYNTLPSHQAFLCVCALPCLIQINTEYPQNSWESGDLGSRWVKCHTYWLGELEQVS